MAKLVSDDYHTVNASAVTAVMKPDSEELWFLSVFLGTQTATLSFPSQAARDDFYKSLVTAMGD